MQAIVETLFDVVYLFSVITIGILMIRGSKGDRQFCLFGWMAEWITSVTMTIFYVLLYYVWRQRYKIQDQGSLTVAVYGLAGVRIMLCMMPKNQWLSAEAPLSWGIYRNIPFALLGLLVIVLFYRSAKDHEDKAFRWMWLTIVLSFGFYIPVVLWADTVPMIGMLMIPKTCAYVWTVLIGYFAMKKECR